MRTSDAPCAVGPVGHAQRSRAAVFGSWLGALLIAGAVFMPVPVRSEPRSPHASACGETCDHKASDCVDRCEETLKDDKARVQCKLTCVAAREKCESACH